MITKTGERIDELKITLFEIKEDIKAATKNIFTEFRKKVNLC